MGLYRRWAGDSGSMPFRNYSGFNDATLKARSAAYDAAIAKLGIDESDPMTS
jgi:hypothetical protein